MLTYDLTERGGAPIYEYLYRCLRRDILSGALAVGERLPSKRALAEHLGVSVITVDAAYSQLVSEGCVEAVPRRGFYVCAQPMAQRAAESAPESAGGAPEHEWRLDLRSNRMDASLFPVGVWAKLTRRVLAEDPDAMLSSVPHAGLYELREAIAAYLRGYKGMSVTPEQVVVGAGSETLLAFLVQLLGRDGGYGVEDPGYAKPHRILTSCGAVVRPIPLDGQGLRVDVVRERAVRVVHVTPSHHYPLGIIMPVARRQALLRWAAEQPGRYILEDDYDSEFRFSGRPIPALQSLDGGERVIYLNTFAKSLAPSLRISYMVLPPHLLEKWRRDFWFYSSTVPSFEQYALARFMEGGHFERHLNRSRTRYKARREALLAAARDTGLTRAGTFAGGDAGLHLLLWMEPRWTEAELVERAATAGVGVTPLSACDLTSPAKDRPPALILGYTRIAAGDMAPALRRLKDAWGF